MADPSLGTNWGDFAKLTPIYTMCHKLHLIQMDGFKGRGTRRLDSPLVTNGLSQGSRGPREEAGAAKEKKGIMAAGDRLGRLTGTISRVW